MHSVNEIMDQMAASITRMRDELAKLDGTPDSIYVVGVGELYFCENATMLGGLKNAARFTSLKLATDRANAVMNGKGERGRVVPLRRALQQSIDRNSKTLAEIREGVAQQQASVAAELAAALKAIMATVAGCQKEPMYEAARAALARFDGVPA